MTALLVGLAVSVAGVGVEVLMKYSASYWGRWWVFVPAAVLTNWGIWYVMRASPSILAGAVLYAALMWLLRPVASLWLGQPIGVGSWIAVGLIFLALGLRIWKP